MDKMFIQERLYVVNYDNENMGLIFSSQSQIEGGAYDIEIEEDTAGWYGLSFSIPSFIIEEGKKIPNRLLKDIYALSRLKYEREFAITEDGERRKVLEELLFIIQPTEHSRNDSGIVTCTFTALDYPRHQLSKSKQGLTINADTIDAELSLMKGNEVRNIPGIVTYIPAPVQTKTVSSTSDLLTWSEALPGAIAIIGTTKYRLINIDYTVIESWRLMLASDPVGPVWNPNWLGYPFAPDPNTYLWGNSGLTASNAAQAQFYWDVWIEDPDKTTGRFDGIYYNIGDRLCYDVYESPEFDYPVTFLGIYVSLAQLAGIESSYGEGWTVYVRETSTVHIYQSGSWVDTGLARADYFPRTFILRGDWAKLSKYLLTLSPNTAENYLKYALKNTDWTVGEVDKIMVPSGEVNQDAQGSPITPIMVEKATEIQEENSNTYGAIGAIAKTFQMYPRFDHMNKTVSLKSIPGMDYGLKFRYRENLINAKVRNDGEKAVSKLWCYGGQDLTSTINIGDYSRAEPIKFKGSFTSKVDLEAKYPNPSLLDEKDYSKVVHTSTWFDLLRLIYEAGGVAPSIVGTFLAGERVVNAAGSNVIPRVPHRDDLPTPGIDGMGYFVEDELVVYVWFLGRYYNTGFPRANLNEVITLEQRFDWDGVQWVDKGQFYEFYEPMSPFGDNYILDFGYFLDRGMITPEEVEDIGRNYILNISNWNKRLFPLLRQRISFMRELLDRNNDYDATKIARDSIERSMRTSYAVYKYLGSSQPRTLVENQIFAYPVGANKGNSGIDFKDTIPNFELLGWTDAQITNSSNQDTYLLAVGGDYEARTRQQGLFESYRRELQGRAGLGPWFNPPENPANVPIGLPGDPTITTLGNEYYDARDRFVEYTNDMEDLLERISILEAKIEDITIEIDFILEKVRIIEQELKNNYEDFIVEGAYTNEDVVYVHELWLESLKALQLYHYPLVTYELEGLDVSGLPEYRTLTDEIYHDIVYRLNQRELVTPSAGDYVYIIDETLGLVDVQAHITSIIRNLSQPMKTQMTIAVVDTNTEDLIGRLVTAANTVFDKQHIYNRAAIINKDGTVATDSVKGTIDDPDAEIVVLGRNGTVRLEGNGIITTDRDDPHYKMQLTGKGLFSSTNDGTSWHQIVSAGKIAIDALSAGAIDSQTISVANKGQTASVVIDGKGITGFLNNSSALVNNFEPVVVDNNVSFFLNARTGAAYFKGMISAGAGDIGGWSIRGSAITGVGELYSTNVGLRASTSSSEFAIWAGSPSPSTSSPFYVLHNGNMTANNATIRGTIEATSGKIGNWSITSGAISNGNTQLTAGGQLIADGVQINSGNISGNLYANYIEANAGGRIGGWYINSNSLYSGTTYLYSSGTNRIVVGSNFSVSSTGYLTCSGASFTGGSITGSSINIASKFKVNSSLRGPELSNTAGGYLTMGNPNSMHAWASGLNLNSVAGMNFWTGADINGGVGTSRGGINFPGTGMSILSNGAINMNSTGGVRIKDSSGNIYLETNGRKLYVNAGSGDKQGYTGSFRYQKNLTDARILEFVNGILIDERGN